MGRLVSPRFLGRRAELDALHAALARAADGVGAVALVGGDAGIGKSRLVTKLADQAKRDGLTVLSGECQMLAEGELPYAPIVTALRSLMRERGAASMRTLASAGHDQLMRLLPDLGLPAEAGADEWDASQSRLFAQVLAVLTAVARERPPLLLVIEDLHWSDRATRDLVAFLVRASREEPIALVLTYRTEDMARHPAALGFIGDLARGVDTIHLTLCPFDAGEVREQVAAIQGEVPDASLVERLLRRAEGNPLFTEELLAADDGEAAALPESLRQALLLRFSGCSADALRVLQAIAVSGGQIQHRLLEDALRLADDRLNRALREAIDAQILLPPGNAAAYRFRHALLSEAAYADLLPGEREAIHARIARAIEQHPALAGQTGATGALAHHWREAGELHCAFTASVQAAEQAELVYASCEALIHYQRALELWEAVAPADDEIGFDRLALLRGAAEAASRSGEGAASVDLARSALAFVADEDPESAALGHELLGRHLWEAGRGDDALPELRRAVELMPDLPTVERARVLATEARILMLCHRFAASTARCAEALQLAARLGARDVEANLLSTIAANDTYGGRPEQGADAAAASRRIARELRLAGEIGRGYVNGSDALDHAGQVEASIALAQEGIAVCGDFGIDSLYGDCLRGEIAGRLLRSGRWDAAAEILEELTQRSVTGVSAGNYCGHLALLHAGRGEQARLHDALARGGEYAARSGGSMWIAPLVEAEATSALWADRPEDTRTVIDGFLDTIPGAESILSTIRIYELGVRAAVDRALQRTGDEPADAARTRITELLGRADGLISELASAPLRVRCSRLAADAEATRLEPGDPVGADAWERAAALWSDCGDVFQVAYARWRQAEAVLMANGDRRAAESLARAAYTTAQALGARPLAGAIEALARRARLAVGDDGVRATGGDGSDSSRDAVARLELTPRELEVLALLGEGMSNKEIAAELFISVKTASVHVSRILAKLSVPNRAAAAAAAQRLGVARIGAQSSALS